MTHLSPILVIRRSLTHRWRQAAALAAAFAIAVAVLAGALIIGDSMRASLGRLLLSRLGETELAATPGRLFPADLAGRLNGRLGSPAAVCTLRVQASLRTGEESPPIPGFTLLGVDADFQRLFPDSPLPRLAGRQVAISQSTARQYGLKTGDDLVILLPRSPGQADATLFSQRRADQVLRPMRLQVASILDDAGPAGFSLAQDQQLPRNLLMDRRALAEAIGQPAAGNLLLITAQAAKSASVQLALQQTLTLADLGLRLQAGDSSIYVQDAGLLLSESSVSAAMALAKGMDAPAETTSVYLAMTIADPSRQTSAAYAMVAGRSGDDVPDGQIDITQWLAEDLAAAPGDAITLDYLVPAADGSYSTASLNLKVRGIVPIPDRQMVPELEGISTAKRIDTWDVPFPVDLAKVKPRDDLYWDQYGPSPKAFLALSAMRAMWHAASPGDARWITGVRVQTPASRDQQGTQAALAEGLPRLLPADKTGFDLRPVRQQAITASQGSADFGILFASMSFFIVISAGAMVATLVRLGVQQRSGELGLMLACGVSRRKTVLMLGGELTLTLLVGLAVGLALAVGYAWTVLRLLASGRGMPWSVPDLRLYAEPATLAAASVACLLGGMACAAMAMRGVLQQPAARLLSGAPAANTGTKPRKAFLARMLAILALAAGVVCLFLPKWNPHISATDAFFPAGGLLLIAGLACFRAVVSNVGWHASIGRPRESWYRRAGSIARRGEKEPTVGGRPTEDLTFRSLIATNLAARPLRSLLTAGLFASASFILIGVALYRPTAGAMSLADRSSPSGGYAMKLTLMVPPGYDLSTQTGRRKLGFTAQDEPSWQGVDVQSLVQAGEGDVSCLNLARPAGARILGIDARFIARGGFTVHTLNPSSQPWQILTQLGPDGVIPIFGDAESMQWILKRSIGEVFDLPRPGGSPLRVQLAGVVEGGLFSGEVLMARENFAREFPQAARPTVFLLDIPVSSLDAVRQSLLRTLGDFGVSAEPVETILDRVLGVQRLYMSIFLLLGGLGLALGSVGQVAILLRQAFERRRELAILLAQGFTRRRVGLLLAGEQATLLLAGLLIGSASAIIAALAVMDHPALGAMALSMALIGAVGCVATLCAIPLAVPRDALRALRQE